MGNDFAFARLDSALFGDVLSYDNGRDHPISAGNGKASNECRELKPLLCPKDYGIIGKGVINDACAKYSMVCGRDTWVKSVAFVRRLGRKEMRKLTMICGALYEDSFANTDLRDRFCIL